MIFDIHAKQHLIKWQPNRESYMQAFGNYEQECGPRVKFDL